ncbi:unnamed protein product [Caenorhabditis auriculariae]|uniref:Uncharacterized protein n=1 Tax=Caenorhabditis auriculariae TaxID=2777116 RepID=A0A8S1GY22_9PELO|nr:unnamed protein product [Caenorhabditis auriculariae]
MENKLPSILLSTRRLKRSWNDERQRNAKITRFDGTDSLRFVASRCRMTWADRRPSQVADSWSPMNRISKKQPLGLLPILSRALAGAQKDTRSHIGKFVSLATQLSAFRAKDLRDDILHANFPSRIFDSSFPVRIPASQRIC